MWRGRRVLVTGGSGFIGSALSDKLVDSGALVFSLCNGQVRQGKCETIIADVRDRNRIMQLLAAYRIEICFHLAAQAIGSIAKQNPVSTLEVNVAGTWNVLEGCRQLGIPLVVASSDKYYGMASPPYIEETFPVPAGIYETSKLCLDFLARSYAVTYKLPIAITRCANIYGPGDRNFTRIVPYAISQTLKGLPVEIWSGKTHPGGESSRDYIFLDDVVDSYMLLAESLIKGESYGEAFNFGTGVPTSVLNLIGTINAIIGVRITPNLITKETGEIYKQWLDCAKARDKLGWKPKFSLEQGLRNTVPWYKQYLGYV